MEKDNADPEDLMRQMMHNKSRMEEREVAIAQSMAARRMLEKQLEVAKEELAFSRAASIVDATEVRRIASDIAKFTRDIKSESIFCEEKLAEFRILQLKHTDLQQQYAQIQMGTKVYKFPGSKT